MLTRNRIRLLVAYTIFCVVLHSEPSQYIRIKSSGTFISSKTNKKHTIPSGYFYSDSEFSKLKATAAEKDKAIMELKQTIKRMIAAHELSVIRTNSLLDTIKQRTQIQDSIKQDLVFKDRLRQDISRLQSKENRNLRRQNQLEKVKGILMFIIGSKF